MKNHKGPSSLKSFAEERGALNDYYTHNPSVARIEAPRPGVHFFEAANPVDDELIILSAGLHGDELAGIRITDTLRKEIYDGALELRRHVVFVDGNLKAMQQAQKNMKNGQPGAARYWDNDAQFGVEANANRMWTRADLNPRKTFESYAGQRRQEIWQGVNDVLLGGADTRESRASLQHQDLHQSFAVPTVKEVRGAYHDESEYTYGIAYNSAEYFSDRFAAVFAGLVTAHPREAQTFAGITARELKAKSITAELGAITSDDEITYAHKMLEALRQELKGGSPLVAKVAPDVWQQLEPIVRADESSEFGFYKAGSQERIKPPRDFVTLKNDLLIPGSENKDQRVRSGKALLFANDEVVVGDRAGLVIEKV